MDPFSQPNNMITSTVSSAPSPVVKIGKFKASLMIVKSSCGILRKDKEMLFFPLLSAITSMIAFALALVVVFFLVLHGDISTLKTMDGSQGTPPVAYIFLFLWYFVTFFIVLFFQTGIVAITHSRLSGKDMSFGEGLQVAFAHIGKIALWSAIAATVGVVLRAIAERSKLLGKIVVSFLGAAWGIVTFFILPVLIIENDSIGGSVKTSTDIVKKTWGESLIVNVGAGFIFMLLALLGVVVFILTLFTQNLAIIMTTVVLLVMYLLFLTVLSSTLDVIFRVVLYEYAKNGTLPEGLSRDVMQMAFTRK